MKFLNGFKTVIGLIGLGLVAISQSDAMVLIPPPAQPYVAGAAALLTALGLVHKIEKKKAEQEQRSE